MCIVGLKRFMRGHFGATNGSVGLFWWTFWAKKRVMWDHFGDQMDLGAILVYILDRSAWVCMRACGCRRPV